MCRKVLGSLVILFSILTAAHSAHAAWTLRECVDWLSGENSDYLEADAKAWGQYREFKKARLVNRDILPPVGHYEPDIKTIDMVTSFEFWWWNGNNLHGELTKRYAGLAESINESYKLQGIELPTLNSLMLRDNPSLPGGILDDRSQKTSSPDTTSADMTPDAVDTIPMDTGTFTDSGAFGGGMDSH